jgi:hypothetical protein
MDEIETVNAPKNGEAPSAVEALDEFEVTPLPDEDVIGPEQIPMLGTVVCR